MCESWINTFVKHFLYVFLCETQLVEGVGTSLRTVVFVEIKRLHKE